MKTNAEYKRDQRKRDKKAGKKRIEFLIDPVNELKIKDYVNKIENKKVDNYLTGQII